MDLLPKPDVILTHESDLDGLVSGLLLQRLARTLFGGDVPLEAYHYQHWKQRELKEGSAWACDFTFEPRMDKSNWVVIDHHPTLTHPQRAALIHDTTKSAGLLCYELCRQHGVFSPDLDRIVHLNNVSDLFLENDPDFVLANQYANLVKSYQFWTLHHLIEGQLERLLDHPLLQVMAVKHRVEDPIGYQWSRRNIVEIAPDVAFVNTLIGNVNVIVHQLLEEKATPHPVVFTLFRRTNGAIIVSFRSRTGQALAMAERLQGGGHPNASGATLPRSIKNVPDALNYLRQVLNPVPDQHAPVNSLDHLFAEADEKE